MPAAPCLLLLGLRGGQLLLLPVRGDQGAGVGAHCQRHCSRLQHMQQLWGHGVAGGGRRGALLSPYKQRRGRPSAFWCGRRPSGCQPCRAARLGEHGGQKLLSNAKDVPRKVLYTVLTCKGFGKPATLHGAPRAQAETFSIHCTAVWNPRSGAEPHWTPRMSVRPA
jgi:hypothetical protein